MQPLDNDMDDLFREAAENYPLRVSGADWNKIAGALSAQHKSQPLKAKSDKKKYLWLLLLLLFPFVCNIYSKIADGKASRISSALIIKENEEKVQYPADNNIASNVNATTTAASDIKNTGTAQSNTSSNNYNPGTFNSDLSAYVNNRAISKKTKTAVQISSAKGEKDVPENNEEVIPVYSVEKNNPPAAEEKNEEKKVPGNISDEKAKDSSINKIAKKEKQSKPAEKKLYVNVLAGPDASRVKGRGEGKIGGSAGLTLGFNINKHFAIEAGALYSVKHYSTEYTYFNNSKTQWPANRIIKIVDGTCKMIEIPVSLRYNFAATTKAKFFAAASLSSYFMKKEDYDYTFTIASSAAQNEVYKSYKKSGNNLFSILQLSAGWQRNIGRFGAVRVQPYYNVPLNGVGIGKLPLSGAGILAGFSIPIK